MAKYRQLHTDFWNDGFVLDLTPEEKYFYLYLMTNTSTAQCGIYELPKRIIETQTGYNRETVDKLLKRFEEYGKIYYCDETKEIMIINWVKYNQPASPNAIKCVNKELKNIKNKEYIYVLYAQCSNLKLDVKKIFSGFEETLPVLCEEKTENKPLIRGYEGACKHLGSNKVISNKQEVINNKQEVTEVISNNEQITSNQEEAAAAEDAAASVYNFEDLINIFENNVHAITPIEYKKLVKWSRSFSCDVILLAVEEAVSNNVRNMRYIDKILYAWLAKGITTPEDVQSYQKEWEENKNKNRNKSSNKGSFDRGHQRKYDLKEIERKLLGWDKEEEKSG